MDIFHLKSRSDRKSVSAANICCWYVVSIREVSAVTLAIAMAMAMAIAFALHCWWIYYYTGYSLAFTFCRFTSFHFYWSHEMKQSMIKSRRTTSTMMEYFFRRCVCALMGDTYSCIVDCSCGTPIQKLQFVKLFIMFVCVCVCVSLNELEHNWNDVRVEESGSSSLWTSGMN